MKRGRLDDSIDGVNDSVGDGDVWVDDPGSRARAHHLDHSALEHLQQTHCLVYPNDWLKYNLFV